jgi:hypothetical protein
MREADFLHRQSIHGGACPSLHPRQYLQRVGMSSNRQAIALVTGRMTSMKQVVSFNHREGVMHMNSVTVLSGVQMRWFPMLAGMFCLVLATGASAATRPCADDTAKLCNGIKPGGGAVAKCLKEQSSELSPACKESITKAKRKAGAFNKACREDARKFCQDEKRGGGRILKCLAQHQDELTPACKEMIDKPIGGRKQQ